MLVLKLLHALCWVYWLGADVGTFYAARFVANPQLSAPQRATAARLMLGVDLAPRICMPLTLATGFHLATLINGWPLSGAVVALVWLLCAAWLAVVLWLHHAPRDATAARVARADFIGRALLAAALAAAAITAWAGMWPVLAPWLALKLLCFAACVACGLAIRIHLKPFGAAFASLVQHGASPAIDATLARSIARCVPWVVAIWVLLIVSAASGMHVL